MHYNTKILEYPNGEIQIRKYSNPLYLSDAELTKEEKRKNIIRNNEKRNPFDNRITSTFFTVEELEERIKTNKYRSLNRTKQAVFNYARCCEWEWFITLTLNKDCVDRYNYTLCCKKVRKWLNNQQNRFAPGLKYLLVPEQHIDGAWHFHGVFACCGNMLFTDSKRVHKDLIIYNLDKFKFGFTSATKVKDVHKVAKYVGKYITKSVSDKIVGTNRYFVSKNLPKIKQTLFFLEDFEVDDFITSAANSFGKEIAHVSHTQANTSFTECTYFELK